MKTNIFVQLLTAGLLIAGISSCNYLEVVPVETVDEDDMLKTKTDAIHYLYSCYSSVAQYNGYNNIGGVETSVDETVNPYLWGRTGQQASWNTLSATYTSNWSVYDLPWSLVYTGIGQCYQFIKRLDETDPLEVTAEDRALWKSEIKFLIAYDHFRLLCLYGPIPIIDRYYPTSTTKDEMPGRSHFDYCVDRICQWLDEAEKGLPANWDNSNIGRATSVACKAVKARLLLYAASPLWNGSFPYPDWANTNYETPGYGKELVSHTFDANKWQKAYEANLEALEYALTTGERSLFSLEASEILREQKKLGLPDIPEVSDDFKKKVMQLSFLMNTCEVDGNHELLWGCINNYFTNNPQDCQPHAMVALNTGFVYGGGCAMAPLLNAVKMFYTENGKFLENDPVLPADKWFESAGYAGHEDVINLNTHREPRFYANIGFDGGEYGQKTNNGNPTYLEMRNGNRHGYNPDKFNRDNSVTGYAFKKFVQPDYVWYATAQIYHVEVPAFYFRLAELYLNLAECEAQLGNTANSLDYLNIIRERAGIPALTESDLVNRSLMDWIQNERYVELFGEAHRYYDARRWLIAPQKFKAGLYEGLNATEKVNPTFAEFNVPVKVDQPFQWSNRMYLLPVKASEIYSNPQLVQAPGY